MTDRHDEPRADATPVRALEAPDQDGVHLLSEVDVGYADGAEAEVLRVLQDTQDLSSTSDELRARARNWPETYHFDPARANFLRALDVPADARVLEVGCGCGAVTRWLGEATALVDGVEPMLPRARAAAERTRDLPSVQIFCGGLDDVPAERAYDLVVVVGVLEYVGHGSPADEPYLDFLRGLEARLAPGGRVVLAIENALGVKYLSGAGEDHSGRPWESLEGYAPDAPARTFTDVALLDLFSRAGLTGTAHGVFPDYKLPRALLSRRALERSDALCASVPRFPSPDWDHPRVRTVSEQMLWTSLVQAGTAATHPNSFVVTARRTDDHGPAGPDLVPDDVSAVILNTGRRREYMTRTVFRGHPGQGTVTRDRLLPGGPAGSTGPDVADGPVHLDGEEPLRTGTDLLELVARAPADRGRLLQRWLDLVDGRGPEGLEIDHVPHNVLVGDDGDLCFVDSEWSWPGRVERSWVVGRGLVWGASWLSHRTYPSAWPGAGTVGDVADELAAAVGLGAGWRDGVLEQESRYQAAVAPRSPRSAEEDQAHHLGELEAMLAQPLSGMPLGERVTHELQRQRELRAEAVHAHSLMEHDRDVVRDRRDAALARTEELERDATGLREQVARLEAELAALRDRRVVRAADGAAGMIGRVRRRG